VLVDGAVVITATVDGRRAVLPALRVLLPGGLVGWYQRDPLDCLRACVATVTRRPYDGVPRMLSAGDLTAWAFGSGHEVDWFYPFAHDPPAGLWVGWADKDRDGWRHTVVCRGDAIIHDPAAGWEWELGGRSPAPAFIEKGCRLC
jgi:hypothetical protein